MAHREGSRIQCSSIRSKNGRGPNRSGDRFAAMASPIKKRNRLTVIYRPGRLRNEVEHPRRERSSVSGHGNHGQLRRPRQARKETADPVKSRRRREQDSPSEDQQSTPARRSQSRFNPSSRPPRDSCPFAPSASRTCAAHPPRDQAANPSRQCRLPSLRQDGSQQRGDSSGFRRHQREP